MMIYVIVAETGEYEDRRTVLIEANISDVAVKVRLAALELRARQQNCSQAEYYKLNPQVPRPPCGPAFIWDGREFKCDTNGFEFEVQEIPLVL